MFADVSSHDSGGMGKSDADAVANYVNDLERALLGADPALIHDALIDAESHLRAAIASGTPALAAIEAFGTPSDIALAYFREQLSAARDGVKEPVAQSSASHQSTVGAANSQSNGGSEFVHSSKTNESVRPWSRLRKIPIIGIYFDPYAWGSIVFLTFGFFLALAAFVWVVGLGAVAIGLLPTLIGIPLLIALLGSARAISLFFGEVIEVLVGIRMPKRAYNVDVSGVDGFWRRMLLWIKDVRGWLTVGFLVGNLPVAVCFFAVTVSLLTASVAMISWGIGTMLGLDSIVTIATDAPITIDIFGTTYKADDQGSFHFSLFSSALITLIGVALLTATLWLSKGAAFVYAQVVKAIQVVRPQSLLQH